MACGRPGGLRDTERVQTFFWTQAAEYGPITPVLQGQELGASDAMQSSSAGVSVHLFKLTLRNTSLLNSCKLYGLGEDLVGGSYLFSIGLKKKKKKRIWQNSFRFHKEKHTFLQHATFQVKK